MDSKALVASPLIARLPGDRVGRRCFRLRLHLLAQQASDHFALERDLTAVLLARGHGLDQELARLTAATFLAALRTGNVLWLEGPDDQPLPEVVDRVLSRVQVR